MGSHSLTNSLAVVAFPILNQIDSHVETQLKVDSSFVQLDRT